MNRVFIKANLALMAIVITLGMTYARAQWPSDIGPPPGWNPGNPILSTCEEDILMLSTCPEEAIPVYELPATICKTTDPFCCEYLAWGKNCYELIDDVMTFHSSAGYAAAFYAEYLGHICPGTGTNVTCVPNIIECRGDDC